MTEEKNALQHKASPCVSATEKQSVPVAPISRERCWAIACHASALLGFVVWVPAANVFGPLFLWLLKKNELPLVATEGKAALNFQLSMTLYLAVALFFMFSGLGFLLLAPLGLANFICIVVAVIKVYQSEPFSYPASIKFIK
jgi:uncharacterized protein